jgi:hypothetical protein
MALTLSAAGRRYGYHKDPVDPRDFGLLHNAFPKFRKVSKVTPLVDLEPLCGPVKDQGDEGACTAFAGTGMREFLYRKLAKFETTKTTPLPVFSAAALYYLERQLNNTLDQGDCGSDGRTSVKVMNQLGVCLDSEDPYVPGNFATAPTAAQLASALKFKAGAYHRLGFQDMKSCLLSGYGFVVGFNVYESFESKIGSDGMMPVPDIVNEQLLGGHEVFFIGYDDSKNAFKVRNSWSKTWGASGNFWMPYTCAADSNIVLDAWMQHLGKTW